MFSFLEFRLVVDTDELTAAVELQVEVVGEFHFVATALLINLRDMGAWEATLYVLGDGSWNDACGNCTVFAIHLVPCAVLIKFYLEAIVQANLVGL